MSSARIVIVGGNFAGLKAAQSLARPASVTVVDPGRWFEWLPNIHELVSGVKRPADLRLPRRRVVVAAGHRFVRARVRRIDARRGLVQLEEGRDLPFDACIVAAGGVHDTFGVPGVERFALPFKSVDQCARIGTTLASLCRGRRPVSVVIVGGGLEGVEALGEILRRYRTRPDLQITVVEAGERLLAGAPPGLDALIREHCEALPVRFAMGSAVAEVRAKEVRLASGRRLPFDLCIWSGGARPAELLHRSHLAASARQWAPVRPTLQTAEFDNVFVAGDAAALSPPLGKQAFYALQMGECAAGNVERLLRGASLLDFAPSPKPMLATFGDIDTFLVFEETAFAGTALAAVKEAIYQLTMAQLDPPAGPSALAALGDRLTHGLAATLPVMMSPRRLLRMSRVRVV